MLQIEFDPAEIYALIDVLPFGVFENGGLWSPIDSSSLSKHGHANSFISCLGTRCKTTLHSRVGAFSRTPHTLKTFFIFWQKFGSLRCCELKTFLCRADLKMH